MTMDFKTLSCLGQKNMSLSSSMAPHKVVSHQIKLERINER